MKSDTPEWVTRLKEVATPEAYLKLCKLEPGLVGLYIAARRAQVYYSRQAAMAASYPTLATVAKTFVGRHRTTPHVILSSTEAYDIVLTTIKLVLQGFETRTIRTLPDGTIALQDEQRGGDRQ